MNSRNGLVSLVVLSVAVLAACTTGGSSTVLPQNAPYFIGMRYVTVDDTDYLDRYACANGTPIVCRRTSTRLGIAECACF